MNDPKSNIGIVLLCNLDGSVTEVVRDETGLLEKSSCGKSLSTIVERGSLAKALNFIIDIKTYGAAFDWQLGVSVSGNVEILNFAGVLWNAKLLIVAAKTSIAHRSLLRQFEAGTVKKEYIAVARGIISPDSFGIKGFLTPDRDSCVSIRKKVVFEDGEGAKYSETAFDVLERKASSTVLRCRPVTGRTNQIRVHLEKACHPLVGDKLYGRTDDEFLAFARNIRAGDYAPLPWLEAPRHLLHASRLTMHHPISGEAVQFDAPLPEDMRSFIRDSRF